MINIHFRDYSVTPSKQITADTCMPMKSGNCYNYCPVYCGSDQKICSGKYFNKEKFLFDVMNNSFD